MHHNHAAHIPWDTLHMVHLRGFEPPHYYGLSVAPLPLGYRCVKPHSPTSTQILYIFRRAAKRCRRRDSNSQSSEEHGFLRPARIPVPVRQHVSGRIRTSTTRSTRGALCALAHPILPHRPRQAPLCALVGTRH